ncbi:pre-toxin TG domain-containing protein [uncultured Enterococcus sp.]|uniref:pre-toxin TG domain-containing protein n=1 Tax=uncultured Enterococcus sp. TaxID=167972 RepID=UPI002AA76E38|nr:pre-toxin TG domain-containing protein [uncultured Enterococcus sp.]
MVKIDFSELSAVANSINNAVMMMSDSFESVKSGASDLIGTSELDSPAWSNTKNYFQTYPVLGDGIWNSAMTVSETLTSYLSAFQSEVGSPKNQLDSDKLQEMQDKLTGIQASRKNLIESMSKAEDYALSNLSNRLSGLDSSAEYFTKEIEILTKYVAFEAAHSSDFSDIQSTIGELKIGMTQISQSKNFNPIKGYARVSYDKMDWYNKVSVFNSEQPEVRYVVVENTPGQYPSHLYKVYKNGVVDKDLTAKFSEIMQDKAIKEMINLAGELSGVYDAYRVIVGKDPVTGKDVTFEEWWAAAFWTALEVVSAAKMLDMLNNIRLNKKLLNGISLTEDELRLFSKMENLGDYKTIEKGSKIGRNIDLNADDLKRLREKLGVPEIDTVAIGKTDIEGFRNIVFEGGSPKVRKQAGLSDLDILMPDRTIKSPGKIPSATRHAEEVILNQFVERAELLGKTSDEIVGTLRIHQSNIKGVCPTCIQGLANPNVPDGIFKQFSKKYPNVTIEVTSEVLEGVRPNGRLEFIIKNGAYVE